MRKRHNYKNLDIWKLGIEIATEISDLLESFPSHERFELRSQISRCSVSIPSNLAEGSARTNKAFYTFIDYAIGSSFELETQLIIAQNRGYISKQVLEYFQKKLVRWQKQTMSFQNSLELG